MREKRKFIQKRKPQITSLTNDWKLTMNIIKQKVLNFVLTLEAEWRKTPQNFLRRTWKTESEKSSNIWIIYADDNKSKYSTNPMNILKSTKKYMKLYTKWTSTAATTEFVWKIPNRKKISYENVNLCEAEISLDEIIK